MRTPLVIYNARQVYNWASKSTIRQRPKWGRSRFAGHIGVASAHASITQKPGVREGGKPGRQELLARLANVPLTAQALDVFRASGLRRPAS